MKNKLAVDDIILLHEGQQAKKKIEEKYGSIRNFYERDKPRGLSIKAIRNYCSYPKVTSDTFKFTLIEKLECGWNEIVISDAEQIKKFINEIYINIHLYKEEADYAVLKRLKNLCTEYELTNETAIIHRCMAKHFYFRNDSQKAIELYREAINMLTERHISTLIILHLELADHLFMESKALEAEKHYNIAESYVQKPNIAEHSLYMFYYRFAIKYNTTGQYQKARDFFYNALEYSRINTKTVSETGATLMGIGTTYERENMHQEAKDYYFKALLYFHEDDINGHGLALNNIAAICFRLKDYDGAIYYIEKARNMFSKDGLTYKLLTSTETYAEIKLQIGDTSACYQYFDLLKRTIHTSISKKKIKMSICNMINILNSVDLLNNLTVAINHLIDNTDNEAYRDELYSCMGRLYKKVKDKEV